MKKTVALFIPGLPFGGAERVVQRLSNILNQQYNLYIILFDASDSKYNCNCEIINMHLPASASKIKKISTIIKRTLKLNQIIKQYKIETVVSFLDGANIINLLSLRKYRSIVSIRNYISSEKHLSFLSGVSDYILKLLYSRADVIVPVSKLIEKSLIVDYKVGAGKIKVIYNPYDIHEILSFAKEELEPFHDTFFKQSKVIISVGRKAHQKGFWHLIKAFSLVKNKMPDAKLVIVGDGEQDSIIRKLIKDLSLEEHVLLTGHQTNPFKFINRSDVYVMTSLFEGFPNSLVEAMACGKSVVSVDCKSGPREILYNNSNIADVAKDIEYADYGVLVPPLNDEENWNANEIETSEVVLSQAIIEVLSNRDFQEKYSRKAFERANEYDYERCKQAFISIID